ncbi:hypothetical protein ACJX0J_042079, partial [Zea mays]
PEILFAREHYFAYLMHAHFAKVELLPTVFEILHNRTWVAYGLIPIVNALAVAAFKLNVVKNSWQAYQFGQSGSVFQMHYKLSVILWNVLVWQEWNIEAKVPKARFGII